MWWMQRKSNHTMKMFQKFHVQADNPGEIYGCDIMEIKGNQHLVVVDYKICVYFWEKIAKCDIKQWFLKHLSLSFVMSELLDKLISDNVRYFVSDEFEVFTAKWNIVHVTSSPRYPQGNSHIEKAIQSVKAIYEKCHNVKMGLLLLKTTPVVSGHDQKCPAESFCKCKLKANLPIFWSAQWTKWSVIEMNQLWHQNLGIMMLYGAKLTQTPSGSQDIS